LALFIGCCVSSAGGVGGGGINVPIFLLVFGYSFKRSVINSYYVVLGNAFAQSLLNIGRKHPRFHAHPMIFWEFVAMLVPAQIGGSNFGEFIVKLVPNFALYLLALLVLLFASALSLQKGLVKWRIENKKLAYKNNQPRNETNGETKQGKEKGVGKIAAVNNPIRMSEFLSIASPLTSAGIEYDDIDEPRISIIGQIQASSAALRSLSTDHRASVVHEAEFMTLPRVTMSAILLMWLCYTSLLVGLHFLSKCSAAYAVVFAILYIPLAACSYWTVLHMRKESKSNNGLLPRCCIQISKLLSSSGEESNKSLIEEKNGPNNTEENGPNNISQEKLVFTSEEINDVHLGKQALQLVFGVFGIGVICSLVGIGGGELLSPLMLSLHLRPEVTSATSAMMSFLNTATIVVKTLTFDTADYGATLFFLAAGFLGGLLGRKVGLFVSTHYGRASYIIFSLVAALALTCVYYIYELGIGAAGFDSGAIC
jgi:uncharacterized membrane protein YfcA